MKTLNLQYELEYQISYAAVVGCLEMKKHEVMQEAYEISIEIDMDPEDDEEGED